MSIEEVRRRLAMTILTTANVVLGVLAIVTSHLQLDIVSWQMCFIFVAWWVFTIASIGIVTMFFWPEPEKEETAPAPEAR